MTDLPVWESRLDWRLGLVAASICAAGLLLGIWLEYYVLTAVGGIGLAIGLWSLLDRRVKLRVDGIGIWYSEWGSSPVQWAEIAGLETRTLRGTRQICVVPHDPAMLLTRMPPGFRWKSWLTKKVWRCRFVISSTRLEHGTPALLGVLQRYHQVRAAEGSHPR